MFLYRDEKFMLPEPDSKLKRGDEVMIITHSWNIEKPHERWRACAPVPGVKARSPAPVRTPARRVRNTHSDSFGLS